jgi:hypothetical protein
MQKGGAVIRRHQKRNLFGTLSVQQYVQACDEVGYGPELAPDLDTCIQGNFSVACLTNMVEECVGQAKNFTEASVAPRFHSPSIAFGRILASDLLANRWKFDAVDTDAQVVGRMAALRRNSYQPKQKEWSLPFGQVEGNSSVPQFYSSTAVNTTVPMADVFLRRGLEKLGLGMESINHAWLGQIFQHDQLFAYQIPEADLANPGVWFIGIHHFPESAVYGLRLTRGTAPGTYRFYFEICADADPFIGPSFRCH